MVDATEKKYFLEDIKKAVAIFESDKFGNYPYSICVGVISKLCEKQKSWIRACEKTTLQKIIESSND